jgi:hypothetical protein
VRSKPSKRKKILESIFLVNTEEFLARIKSFKIINITRTISEHWSSKDKKRSKIRKTLRSKSWPRLT